VSHGIWQGNMVAGPLRKRLTSGQKGISPNTFRVARPYFPLIETENGDFPPVNQIVNTREVIFKRLLSRQSRQRDAPPVGCIGALAVWNMGTEWNRCWQAMTE
jgi:hypothetical protein